MTDKLNFEPTRQFLTESGPCPNCGTELKPEWTFCGSCGGTVEPIAISSGGPASEDPPVSPPVSPGPAKDAASAVKKRRSRSTAVLASALALAVFGAAVGWVLEVQRAHDLNQRAHDLKTTRATLTATSVVLSSTKADLESTRGDLTQTRSELTAAKADAAKTKGSLSGAEHRLDLQAGQIATLKTCLGGVQRALSYVAYSDFNSALSELSAVQTACRKANDVF